VLGNGNGTFQTPVNFAVGTAPFSVAVGDFDGNTTLDVAVANSGSNTVSVLSGNGNGTLQPAVNHPVGLTPKYVAAGDWDGDGSVDLVVANGGAANLSVLMGNGDGTFQAQIPYQAGTSPMSIAVADVNSDGAPDLTTANFDSRAVSTLLNLGGTALVTGSSVNPSNFGQPVTFTTTIVASLRNAGTPTGTITFKDGDVTLGSSGINAGQASFTTSGLSVGTHTINALYSGDSNFNPNAALPFTQVVNGGGPVVSLSPTSLSFPVRLVGSPSPAKTVTLTNTGTATLQISGITITGANPSDFSQTNNCGTNLAPNASCTIRVVFTPQAKNSRTAAVTITDNAPDSPQSVALSGIGTVVKLQPANLNLGNQQVGTSSQPKPVTLTNIGSTPLQITRIGITGANAADFSQTNNCGSNLGPGASCTINVTFTPTAVGSRSAFVNIIDDGGGSPQRVALSGTGT